MAVSGDKTDCGIPKIAGIPGWLLRREISTHELPPAVLFSTYYKGFCMLDEEQLDSGTEFDPGLSG